MTQAGIILGTAAYMSPEQARGRAVDRRADIWAFGCVLYEMLTAKRAYDAETVTDTIAAIVTREPDWNALPAATPAHVRTLIARCLIKDARQRLRDIGDARIELGDGVTRDASPHPGVRERSSWRFGRLPWAVTAATVIAAATIVFLITKRTPQTAGETVRFSIQPPAGIGGPSDVPGSMGAVGHIVLSPDGRRLATLATVGGGRLWIRNFNGFDAQQITGTEGASQPFWSADGRDVGFFTTHLKIVDLTTGTIRTSIPVNGPRGGTWNQSGVILFGDERRVIHRIPAGGGVAEPVTTLEQDRGDARHAGPVFLEDGRRFLFFNRTNDARSTGIYLGALDKKETRLIAVAESNGAYAAGYVLFVRGGTLMAHRYDLDRGSSGEAVAIAQDVAYVPMMHHAEFSVADSAVLAYSFGALSELRIGWFDRQGNLTGIVEASAHMTISPDDSRVAADRIDTQTGMRDVWVFDQRRGTRTRLTFSAANDWVPAWTPDGTRVLYTSDRENPGGPAHIYQRAANGSGAEELVLKTDDSKHHIAISPDGRFLVYEANSRTGIVDLWLLPLTGPRQTKLLLGNPHAESQPSFSPDGRFLAYISNESGSFEVYVQTFPDGQGRWQISTNGGVQPQWRGDGREMYYLAADGKMMALDVDLKAPSFAIPHALFETAIAGQAATDHFAVTSDGQRFLLQAIPPRNGTGINVVLNWTAELPK